MTSKHFNLNEFQELDLDKQLIKRIDYIDDFNTIIGWAKDGAGESDAAWQIQWREVVGDIEYINIVDEGRFSQVWDDRAILFPNGGASSNPNHSIPVRRIVDEDGQAFSDANPMPTKPSGLTSGGRITEVTVNATGWTALPATALAGRNALAIQNKNGGGTLAKVNHRNDVGFIGMEIEDGQERFYDITDTIIIYGRCQAGSITLNIEELA